MRTSIARETGRWQIPHPGHRRTARRAHRGGAESNTTVIEMLQSIQPTNSSASKVFALLVAFNRSFFPDEQGKCSEK
jgi:hypothetical protein